jgi:hypothetical protein
MLSNLYVNFSICDKHSIILNVSVILEKIPNHEQKERKQGQNQAKYYQCSR